MTKEMKELMEQNQKLQARLNKGLKMYAELAEEHNKLINRFNGAVQTYKEQKEKIRILEDDLNRFRDLIVPPEQADWDVPSNCNKLTYYRITIGKAVKEHDIKDITEFRNWLSVQDCPNKSLAVRAYNELNK